MKRGFEVRIETYGVRKIASSRPLLAISTKAVVIFTPDHKSVMEVVLRRHRPPRQRRLGYEPYFQSNDRRCAVVATKPDVQSNDR